MVLLYPKEKWNEKGLCKTSAQVTNPRKPFPNKFFFLHLFFLPSIWTKSTFFIKIGQAMQEITREQWCFLTFIRAMFHLKRFYRAKSKIDMRVAVCMYLNRTWLSCWSQNFVCFLFQACSSENRGYWTVQGLGIYRGRHFFTMRLVRLEKSNWDVPLEMLMVWRLYLWRLVRLEVLNRKTTFT